MKLCDTCGISITSKSSFCENCKKEYRKNYERNWNKNNREYSTMRQNVYRNTLKGKIASLYTGIKNRAHEKSMLFDIDTNFLLSLWEEQRGLCALTKIELSLDNKNNPHPFSPSIDRINSDEGYTKNNVRFVCYAINCSLNEFGEKVFDILANAYTNKQLPVSSDMTEICLDAATPTNKNLSKSKRYRESFSGLTNILYHNSRKRAELKKLQFSITKDDIKELLQKGKCDLTNIDFLISQTSSFSRHPLRPSLDRIDSTKGYTKDNVRLICVAVNYALNKFGEGIFKQICEAYLKAN